MAESTLPSEERSFFQWCLRNPIEVVAILLLIAFTALVFLQVLFRYALHAPLAWSEEVVMFLLEWCIFLGAAVAVRRQRHFYVELVVHRLSPRGQLAIQVLTSIIIFGVSYVMIHMGIKLVIAGLNYYTPTLQLPYGYVYSVLPLCGALMAIFQVPIFIRQVLMLTRG